MSEASRSYLILYPLDPDWVPKDQGALEQQLNRIGLIGNRRQPGRFSSGPAYLELVAYLGCSPHIALGEAEDAMLVSFGGPFDKTQFRAHPNARPRCPACRQNLVVEDIPERPDGIISCPHCGISHQACKLNWRNKAGFGRFFVEISNVHESEAVPGETLLEELGSATGQAWGYFYWQEN